MCQKWLDEVFRVLSKVSLGNYSDFLYMKLQQHEDLKIDANDFFGNNFVYEPKMAQKEVF